MTTHFGIGFSQNINIEKAAQDAAFQSKSNLKSDKIDLAIVFSTIHYNPQRTIPVLNKILNNAKMIGTSTAGIILPNSVKTRGIGILTINSDELKLGIGSIRELNTKDVRQAGSNLVKNSLEDSGQQLRQAFLFLADGHLKQTTSLLRGMQDILGNAFSIVGVGNSDDLHNNSTFQIFENNVIRHSVIGLLLGGQSNIGIAGRHGWRPLGKPRIVQEANGRVLKKIEGQKAISLYERYFNEGSGALSLEQLRDIAAHYPLGIALKGSREYLIRNAVDFPSDGSIVCQGDVPVGAQVHIMIGNKDSCYRAAAEAAKEAHHALMHNEAKLVIIFESMSRLRLLGRDAFREIKKVKEAFGPNALIFGMYTNGEVYPLETSEPLIKPHHQNHSIVVLALN